MAHKVMKARPMSLVLKEMRIQFTVRCRSTPVRMANIRDPDNSDAEEPQVWLVGMHSGTVPHGGQSVGFLQAVFTMQPCSPLLGTYLVK